MTWTDVKARFPDRWVTLVETDWVDDRSFVFRSTQVIGQGATRAEAMAQARPLLSRYGSFGCFYTGRIRAPRYGLAAT